MVDIDLDDHILGGTLPYPTRTLIELVATPDLLPVLVVRWRRRKEEGSGWVNE